MRNLLNYSGIVIFFESFNSNIVSAKLGPLLLSILTTACLCSGCCTVDMSRYESLNLPPDGDYSQERTFTFKFLGNTNILLSDGDTTILTDGFFTRSGYSSIIRAQSDAQQINQALSQFQIDCLDYVIPLHNHFDHAMDSAEVAHQTGARIVGTKTAKNLILGWQTWKEDQSFDARNCESENSEIDLLEIARDGSVVN